MRGCRAQAAALLGAAQDWAGCPGGTRGAGPSDAVLRASNDVCLVCWPLALEEVLTTATWNSLGF